MIVAMRSTGESEVSCSSLAVVLTIVLNYSNFNVISGYTTLHDKQQITKCFFSLTCCCFSAEYKVSPEAILKQTQSLSSSGHKPKER